MLAESEFWRGKRVLVTGHSGFKGGWMCLLLNKLGADVSGISLQPETDLSLFDSAEISKVTDSRIVDIRNYKELQKQIDDIKPDIIFHMAAQALVRASYKDPLKTYSSNFMGTANLLEAARHSKTLSAVVIVTTDKVYKNNEWLYPYRENDTLGGFDPYSASKAASEILVSSYRQSFYAESGIKLASVRAGNVIGGGDWSEDRLIPDLIKAWNEKEKVVIRSPQATRPWQHVLEPVSTYLKLAEALVLKDLDVDALNVGPKSGEAATVEFVVSSAAKQLTGLDVEFLSNKPSLHEANYLALDISAAREALSYEPVWELESSLKKTLSWYCSFKNGRTARDLCNEDIETYMKDCIK